MARNQEKAQSMLFRFREAQLHDMGLVVPRTMRAPSNTQLATSVRECERWRRDVFDDISKKITRIQDVNLGEQQIRDLNDDINRLLRKKKQWEDRIRELGGPDYRRGAAKMFDADGKEVPGSRGYKYFGRARELPGIKELFEQAPPLIEKTNKTDLYKNIDAEYYGYRDDEDGELVKLEKEQELKNEVDCAALDPFAVKPFEIPTQKQVEEFLVARKKQQLMERYLPQ